MPLSLECRCGASRSSSWKILLSRVMLWGIGTNHVSCFDWIIGRIPGDLYVSCIPPPPALGLRLLTMKWLSFFFLLSSLLKLPSCASPEREMFCVVSTAASYVCARHIRLQQANSLSYRLLSRTTNALQTPLTIRTQECSSALSLADGVVIDSTTDT